MSNPVFVCVQGIVVIILMNIIKAACTIYLKIRLQKKKYLPATVLGLISDPFNNISGCGLNYCVCLLSYYLCPHTFKMFLPPMVATMCGRSTMHFH